MQKTRFPLHPAQHDLFTDQLLNIGSPEYNIGGYLKLKGQLNKEKFHEAVSSAPKVFDVFKTRFDLNEPADAFFDGDYEELQMAELDFSGRANPEEEVRSWMQNHLNTPFIIQNESLLFEHFLITISADEHWFFGKYHHLITDGYGFTVFINYIARKYRSLVGGDDVPFSYPSYRE